MSGALKEMYNVDSVSALATAVQYEYPDFDIDEFMARIFTEEWERLELKGRMRHITTVLGGFLPGDYPAALAILRRVLPTLGQHGFEKMIFPDFVELYGLDDYDNSMAALQFFTQYISAEFAVRPFIDRYPQRAMAQMLVWTTHAHPGVRRLASEGCRPRLPWAMALPALKADPTPILPILERLKDDPEESVRRSVANNLNDIAKDNPQVVLDTLETWQAAGTAQIKWITSHALRTLIKQGHPRALSLLGYDPEPAVTLTDPVLTPTVVPFVGELTFTFDIISEADRPQALIIDYVVYLLRANGSHSPKVFKLSKRTLQPGETLTIERKHSFRPVTTRKYYPGQHAIQPQVNGKRFGRVTFTLAQPFHG